MSASHNPVRTCSSAMPASSNSAQTEAMPWQYVTTGSTTAYASRIRPNCCRRVHELGGSKANTRPRWLSGSSKGPAANCRMKLGGGGGGGGGGEDATQHDSQASFHLFTLGNKQKNTPRLHHQSRTTTCVARPHESHPPHRRLPNSAPAPRDTTLETPGPVQMCKAVRSTHGGGLLGRRCGSCCCAADASTCHIVVSPCFLPPVMEVLIPAGILCTPSPLHRCHAYGCALS